MNPEIASRYARLARQTQADARVPAMQVAVHRADRLPWTFEVGDSGTDRPLDGATQFRLGSVTKTFTAVLVMQCRDDGRLDLDDRIGAHLDLPAHGDLTIRRLLSHTSGIQREPHGDVWETLRSPDLDGMLADLTHAERVLPPGRRFHYSNLGMALLGAVVGKIRGEPWAELIADRILGPLGLTGVTAAPTPAAAVGFMVDAYSDHARAEPPVDTGAIAPAAQLWGTATDLARWAGFLVDPATVDPAGAVLAPATLEEMRWPAAVSDESVWTSSYGLGLITVPTGAGTRILHVGHDGAMPGFLAGVYGRRGGDAPAALGVAVLGSSGTAGKMLELPHALLGAVAEHDPADVVPWRIGEPAPAAYRSILGRWWGEGSESVFSWRDGRLRARGADDAPGRPLAVFTPTGDADVLRTESGREVGELLRLTRDPATGDVVRMHWATYLLTRTQMAFDGFDMRHR